MRSKNGSAGRRPLRPDGGGLRAAHDSPNTVLTDTSIRAISAAVIAAMRLLILLLTTARNWSQSATELAPSEGIATTIGGATLGELESGITRRCGGRRLWRLRSARGTDDARVAGYRKSARDRPNTHDLEDISRAIRRSSRRSAWRLPIARYRHERSEKRDRFPLSAPSGRDDRSWPPGRARSAVG